MWFSYGGDSRLTATEDTFGAATYLDYGAVSNAIPHTHALGHATYFAYDVLCRGTLGLERGPPQP